MYQGGTGYGTGYHGYWVQNYYRANPHFGAWADVEDFSEQLHAARMRYILDITLNDSNPWTTMFTAAFITTSDLFSYEVTRMTSIPSLAEDSTSITRTLRNARTLHPMMPIGTTGNCIIACSPT
jgi:alpha-amylase